MFKLSFFRVFLPFFLSLLGPEASANSTSKNGSVRKTFHCQLTTAAEDHPVKQFDVELVGTKAADGTQIFTNATLTYHKGSPHAEVIAQKQIQQIPSSAGTRFALHFENENCVDIFEPKSLLLNATFAAHGKCSPIPRGLLKNGVRSARIAVDESADNFVYHKCTSTVY